VTFWNEKANVLFLLLISLHLTEQKRIFQ